MSIQAVGWVLECSEAKGITRLVLIGLANHANDRGICFPSMRTLAREAHVSLGAVSASIDRLTTLGEVEIIQPGDNRRSTRYRLTYKSVREMNADSSPNERSARSWAERSVHSWGEQNHQEPSTTITATRPPMMETCKKCGLLQPFDCECA